jgi:hypothetical protein
VIALEELTPHEKQLYLGDFLPPDPGISDLTRSSTAIDDLEPFVRRLKAYHVIKVVSLLLFLI